MFQLPQTIIDFCVELLYPKRCVACDKVLLNIEKERGFCQACASKVKLVGPDYCLKCGTPIYNKEELCHNCKIMKHSFEQNKGIFQYTGSMKDGMYRFKYFNRRCYGRIFADHAVKCYGGWLKEMGIEAIVPVPMYKAKERRRGYNQATVFARALGKKINIPVYESIVVRQTDTVAMKQLNQLKRKKNLLKAFTTSKNIVQFRKVLLVDDIYTTGTTLDEVSKALKDGGIKEVYGLCVCIGEMQRP